MNLTMEQLRDNFERGLSLKVWNTDYVPELSSNGGSYRFITKYKNLGNGIIEEEYATSADFDYCSSCGRFDNHKDCEPTIKQWNDEEYMDSILGFVSLENYDYKFY